MSAPASRPTQALIRPDKDRFLSDARLSKLRPLMALFCAYFTPAST